MKTICDEELSPEELKPLKELDKECDEALKLAWERLGASDMTDQEVVDMVRAWRLKRRIYDKKEAERVAKKEAKQSDGD